MLKIYQKEEHREYFFEEGCHILELLNTDECKDLSIARARVAPGEQTKVHRLNDTTEVYHIISGRGIVHIDGDTAEVSEGDSVIIRPNMDQAITNVGDQDLIFYCICTPRFEKHNYQDTER